MLAIFVKLKLPLIVCPKIESVSPVPLTLTEPLLMATLKLPLNEILSETPVIDTTPEADPLIPPPAPCTSVKSPTPAVTFTIPPIDRLKSSTCRLTLFPDCEKVKLPLICWL